MESTILHLVNFPIFLAALFAFEFFMKEALSGLPELLWARWETSPHSFAQIRTKSGKQRKPWGNWGFLPEIASPFSGMRISRTTGRSWRT